MKKSNCADEPADPTKSWVQVAFAETAANVPPAPKKLAPAASCPLALEAPCPLASPISPNALADVEFVGEAVVGVPPSSTTVASAATTGGAALALANKTARIAWAMLRNATDYQPDLIRG